MKNAECGVPKAVSEPHGSARLLPSHSGARGSCRAQAGTGPSGRRAGRVHIAWLVLLGVALLAAGGAGSWWYSVMRRVDGRTAAEWVLLAQQAAQQVPYRAAGRTWTAGTAARFTLEQGTGGRYVLRTHDTHGRSCTLGDDGTKLWYQTGADTREVATPAQTPITAPHRARLLGTGSIAARPVVRVRLRSGQLTKTLAIDRRTGVILAMRAQTGRREVSRMQLETITYGTTAPACAAPATSATTRTVTRADLTRALGGTLVEPQWLPAGFTLRGRYLSWCGCCNAEVATLRYSDGLRALTLFEKTGHACRTERACRKGARGKCRMAPGGQALVSSRILHGVQVIAVGDVERGTLERVMGSLQ